eukprot:2148933-Pleurochrysis_carterae.AAC.3
MADLLSMDRLVGAADGKPRSSNSERKYTAFLVALDAAMISASQDDEATDGCFLDGCPRYRVAVVYKHVTGSGVTSGPI